MYFRMCDFFKLSNKSLVSLVKFPVCQCFPGGLVSKESACNTGNLGLIPGLERSPGEGNGNLLQYCCLENPINRGAL